MALDNIFGSSTFGTTSVEVRWHHTTLTRCDRVVRGESTRDKLFPLCMCPHYVACAGLKNLGFNWLIQNFHVIPVSARCRHFKRSRFHLSLKQGHPAAVTCQLTFVDQLLVDIAHNHYSTLLHRSILRIPLSISNNDWSHMQWSPRKESKSEMQRRWYDRRFEKVNSSSSRNETGKNQVWQA